MKYAAIATVGKHYLLSNYGSFFQHYALRQVLKKIGLVPFRVRAEDEQCSRLPISLERIKDGIRPYYWLLKGLPGREGLVKQLRFRNKINKKFLYDFRSLIAPLDEQMVFNEHTYGVKGGDQVLCPGDDRSWLSEIPKGNPKVCYAASTDWCYLSEHKEIQDCLRSRLMDYSAIGLRESHGVELVSCLIGESDIVARVVDPVFFLSQNDMRRLEAKSPAFKKKTLFCYLVNIRGECDIQYDRLVSLAKHLGCDLRIAGIQGAESFVPRNKLMCLSPTQFLRAVDDAQYFVTNSFHGLVFGIVNQKALLFIPQNNLPGTDQNERQLELLNRYDLLEHCSSSSASAEDMAVALRKKIDWDATLKITAKDCEFSYGWLKELLR